MENDDEQNDDTRGRVCIEMLNETPGRVDTSTDEDEEKTG